MKQAHSLKVIRFSYQSSELPDRMFRCESIKNSTEYLPGQNYSKREVDSLCVSRSWDVTIVDATKS